MSEEIVTLLLEQPFERIMEMAARQEMTVHYDPRCGDYHCKYPIRNGWTEVAPQKSIKLAVVNAIVSMVNAKESK